MDELTSVGVGIMQDTLVPNAGIGIENADQHPALNSVAGDTNATVEQVDPAPTAND